MTKYSTIKLSELQKIEIVNLVEPNCYRVINRSEFPSFIPDELASKCEFAYVAAAPSNDGNVYVFCDMHRVDTKASMIDREPLLAIVTSGGVESCATFAHHGSWNNRSYTTSQGYWDHVRDSGVGNYYNSEIPADVKTAPIDELPEGEKDAFEAILTIIADSGD